MRRSRHAGDPSDGVIARRQLAQVLVASLTSESALRKTFELVAVNGPAQHDLAPLFAALEGDPPGGLNAVPGERHWHGASPTTAMTHIAIAEMLDGKVVEWMEHVTDEQCGR